MADAMHTPLPWAADRKGMFDATGRILAVARDDHPFSFADACANAAFIVECCNGRPALEAAKQEAEDRYLDQHTAYMQMREANEALVEALTNLRRRFHSAIISTGSDPEYADIACAKADAAINIARGLK